MKELFLSRRLSLILFLLGYALPSMQSQHQLTLDECLQKVRDHAAEFKQLPLAGAVADLEKKIISRNFWPQASLGGKATWQSDVTGFPVNLPGVEVPGVPKEQFAATFDIQQMIYDGGITKAMSDIQDAQLEWNSQQLEASLLLTDKDVTDLFFQIALQEKLQINAKLLKGQLEESRNQFQKLLLAGMTDKRDLLALNIRMIEIDQKISEGAYYIQMAKESLQILMNEPDQSFEIVIPQRVVTSDIQDFSNRPEIKLIEAQRRLLQAQHQLNEAKVKPSLVSFLNTGYGRPGLNFLSDQFDWYAMAGVRINIPVDQLYTRKKEMQKQVIDLKIESANLSRADLLTDFSMMERKGLDEMEKLDAWLLEDAQMVDLRGQMVEIGKSKWEGGMITTAEYVNEVTEWSLAKERMATHEVMLARQTAQLYNLYGLNINK